MTRMIERWFPCKEVSEGSVSGWGHGRSQKALFTWFASRPPAQAKAAVICSLLPWPDDEKEQRRLQDLVKQAMMGHDAVREEIRAEIEKANPEGVNLLDPFSGRGTIPFEAARLGLQSQAMELSAVATIATHLLTDYPFRDWSAEPAIPFRVGHPEAPGTLLEDEPETTLERYYEDVKAVLQEVGRRHAHVMKDFYPKVDGQHPWGYLWAVTLPCQECGRRFPLVGSYALRMPSKKKANRSREAFDDPGQSFYIDADPATGDFVAVVHNGPPRRTPTLTRPPGQHRSSSKGKSATCPFCRHVHPKDVHQRLAAEGKGRDALLVVADHDPLVGKCFRAATDSDRSAAASAEQALLAESYFSPVLPPVPHEGIAVGNADIVRPSGYGALTYGDLMNGRQTLSFVRLARVIDDISQELLNDGLSERYVRALAANAGAILVRKIRLSTRGVSLRLHSRGGVQTSDLFVKESTIAFSYDYFESGIGSGPGTWESLLNGSAGGLSTLRTLLKGLVGYPTEVINGSSTSMPVSTNSISAVVTDPPYGDMIAYADASDIFFVWLKRALVTSWPEMAVTPDEHDTQDKTEEIIVKRDYLKRKAVAGDHRNQSHYEHLIACAFAEMRRVVREDGVVTIVFGHGDPDVWRRLLGAISSAGLVLTGSWPANTEPEGQEAAANIKTTLTMACRPAAPSRPEGMRAQVEAEVRAEVASRMDLWERSGLAPTDMLMASAGPAMEVVGRYSSVVDIYGESVDSGDFLLTARRAVRESARIEIDHHPLDTFDARTRFALWWVRLFGKDEAAKSELRWQTLADDLEMSEVRDLMPSVGKCVRFTSAARTKFEITPESPVIDVALAMAKAWPDGAAGVGAVLAAADKGSDPYLWAAVTFLADRLPDSDPDGIAFTGIVRAKGAVTGAARGIHVADEKQRLAEAQATLDFSGEG